jgi:DNA-binding response OmpR family regulator
MSAETRCILLVEDDESEAALMLRALRSAWSTVPVRVARDGDEAVACLCELIAGQDQADGTSGVLVMLDIKLPRRNGLEVLAWIRDQAALSEVPVVMLTSSSDARDVQRAGELGADGYLVKPTAYTKLVELVADLPRYWDRRA